MTAVTSGTVIARLDPSDQQQKLAQAQAAVAAAQAAGSGHSAVEEMLLLTTHGILHLLGYDHMDDADRLEMFALQDRLVSEVLGRPAPAPTIED